MIEVKVRDGSTGAIDSALKTFKKLCQKDGFMQELRERRYFKKPSVKKRDKIKKSKRNK